MNTRILPQILLGIGALISTCETSLGADILKFAFGNQAVPDHRAVAAATPYDTAAGFGFEGDTSAISQTEKAATSDKPFLFSVALPEGFYDVTVKLGGVPTSSTQTVKAEARRLMLHAVPIGADKTETRKFTVAVKRPVTAKAQAIKLKPSQSPMNWDDKLTLEFNGDHPALMALEIAPAKSPLSVFIAGDSTVTDQGGSLFTGWGQMLPRFFKSGVVVYNNAQSGDSLSSFKNNGLLTKIMETARPGDYLLIQFGHNDQKSKREGAGPFTTYKDDLKKYVALAREKKMHPVLVTPMERRRFKDGVPSATLHEFAEAVRQVGREEKVPVIDLNVASLKLYAALGEKGSEKVFLHYDAGQAPDGRPEALHDNTHFDNYGGYELARIVATGIKDQSLDLAKYLSEDFVAFDPSKPDDIRAVMLPLSPAKPTSKPEGS